MFLLRAAGLGARYKMSGRHGRHWNGGENLFVGELLEEYNKTKISLIFLTGKISLNFIISPFLNGNKV
jgi:hypothetical protein